MRDRVASVVIPSSYITLFAGAGGLDLGLRIALPKARCIGAVEINREAAEILAARMREGSFDRAPVWSDVRTFPCELYRGRVAGIIGGFPCTDLSVAGKQAGIHGEHSGLWFEYLRILRETDAQWALIENVPAVIAFPAGGTVLGGLAEIGFDAEWLSIRASDVGASHGRLRVFFLAYRKSGRLVEHPTSPRCSGRQDAGTDPGHAGTFRSGSAEFDRGCEPVDDAELPERRAIIECRNGRGEGSDGKWEAANRSGIADEALAQPEHPIGRPEHQEHLNAHGRDGSGRSGVDVGHSDQPGLEGRPLRDERSADERAARPASSSELADAGCERNQRRGISGELAEQGGSPETDSEQWQRSGNASRDSLPLFAPRPGATQLWQDLLVRHPELRPAISQAEIERLVHDLDDGLASALDGSRTDGLRACGNGVVALCAAASFVILAKRAGILI